MKLSSLPIPDILKESYAKKGILSLYPPQQECIEKGLFEKKNLLISIPTASGKTLIAEMAMHYHLAEGGKCLYIVPLRALASEKFAEFSGKNAGIGIATGDFDRRDEYLGRNDIIVATSEKVDSLLRNRASWLSRISLLVIDEIHLIDSERRGVTLEMVITKIRFTNPEIQLIGLSATIGNPKKLAGWLGADLVTSTWRPTDLRQGVYCNGTIEFHDQQRRVKAATKNDDYNLCLDTLAEGGQCLVFVSSRKNAEGFAKRAGAALKHTTPDLDQYGDQLEKLAATDMDKVLADCVRTGVAFHHAGLRREQRTIIEEAYKKGHIKIISATPTLAAGLNLPARRVIIRDYLRFESGIGMVPIPALEYHQMAGRAGRPHLDPYGEAVLIAKDETIVPALFEWYIDASPEEIHSQCEDESALCAHVLSIIASGFATSRVGLTDFMKKTFFQYENPSGRVLERGLAGAVAYLKTAGMVKESSGNLSITDFGSIVSQLYLDPRSAELIADIIPAASSYSERGLLHLLCMTPDMMALYLKQRDRDYLMKYLRTYADQLWIPPAPDDEQYYRALKTSMLLMDWTDEQTEKVICDRYGVSPGDIFSAVESVSWLLHAASRLARLFRPDFIGPCTETSICIKNGVRRELLPLIRLRNIGRVRARKLFNQGIVSPEMVRAAGIDRIASILGRGVALLLFKEGAGLPDRPFPPQDLEVSPHIPSQAPHDAREDTDRVPEPSLPATKPVHEESTALGKLPGVGKKKELLLRSSGIRTTGDLRRAGQEKIAAIVGKKTAESIFDTLADSYRFDPPGPSHDTIITPVNAGQKKGTRKKKPVLQQNIFAYDKS